MVFTIHILQIGLHRPKRKMRQIFLKKNKNHKNLW